MFGISIIIIEGVQAAKSVRLLLPLKTIKDKK